MRGRDDEFDHAAGVLLVLGVADALAPRAIRQAVQQRAAQAAPLPVVGDGDRNLGEQRTISSLRSPRIPEDRSCGSSSSYRRTGASTAAAFHATGKPTPALGAPLFITLGRRRRDGSYARLGGRCGQEVISDVLKRLGAAAELPDELRHPHALRQTCATELLRAGAASCHIAD